ncbi:MAG: sensor histidine kinase [Haloechinothrix sp.]
MGFGIAREELERIFELFYRVGGDGGSVGRGIGLTIARSIARAHGGDVSASSQGPGHGATFILSLPLVGV